MKLELTLQLAVGERGPGDEREEREEEGGDGEAGHFVKEKKKAVVGFESFFSEGGREREARLVLFLLPFSCSVESHSFSASAAADFLLHSSSRKYIGSIKITYRG